MVYTARTVVIKLSEMSDTRLRTVGVFLLITSFVLAYFYVLLPLEAAKNGAPEVSQASKILFLTPSAFVFGLLMLALGRKGRDLIQTENDGKQRLTLVGWVVMAVCIAGGIGLNEWLESELAARGYANGAAASMLDKG
jgi:hypothetical protein